MHILFYILYIDILKNLFLKEKLFALFNEHSEL